VSTTAIPERFTSLPDEHALAATVVALEEHGFSVEVAGDLDAARQGFHAIWRTRSQAPHRCPSVASMVDE